MTKQCREQTQNTSIITPEQQLYLRDKSVNSIVQHICSYGEILAPDIVYSNQFLLMTVDCRRLSTSCNPRANNNTELDRRWEAKHDESGCSTHDQQTMRARIRSMKAEAPFFIKIVLFSCYFSA